VVVTQGFIARGARGGTVLLGRGGSDASAAYLAAALDAEILEIWSDVPGLFTADPRQVPDARLLRRLDYAEAHAVASLGARALHPRAIEPCRRHGIVMRLGWTAYPDVEGTRIGALRGRRGPRAVTARREVALIAIERPRAWQEVGFLAAVGEIASRRRIAIDLIASSPGEIRITVDLGCSPAASAELDTLVGELERVGRTTRWSHLGTVSAVGTRHTPLAFQDAEAQMVAHAADGSHVSVVVDRGLMPRLLRETHAELFEGHLDPAVFGPRWEELQSGVAAAKGGDRCQIRA
jgi:diaminopimelate decarboxylase/aspartate kinase